MEILRQPWPWFVAGPLIGLFVPVLLFVGNKAFGFSSNLRHICAAVFPGRIASFRYDWKGEGGWNLVFLAGTVAGGFVAVHVLGLPDIALSDATKAALSTLGLHDFSGLVPLEVFGWARLLSLRGLVLIVGGGFLVGFGTAYAGGCTSGHAIAGLADFQLPSLVAVLGFFAGGLLATHVLLPLLF
jgi:uncharacterized membrane protein YedE/YeeE